MSVQVLQGDCRQVLPTLPPESVQCVITSPPFYGLRDYGTASWEGGEAECAHTVRPAVKLASSTLSKGGSTKTQGHQREGYRGSCGRCGAVRVDKQIGLEENPHSYLEALVNVFAEVHRVLRPDGVLWVEMGDSYSGAGYSNHVKIFAGEESDRRVGQQNGRPAHLTGTGLPPKSLMGMPWRLAFALQEWGWLLRSEIIWHRPNPMPESVRDRPTRAHSTVFLFSKQGRYYYDAVAIAEPAGVVHAVGKTSCMDNDRDPRHGTNKQDAVGKRTYAGFNERYRRGEQYDSRNARSVWTLPTQPYSSGREDVDHFATFPEALVERMLLASTAPQACPHCGASWRRLVTRTRTLDGEPAPELGGWRGESIAVPTTAQGMGHWRIGTTVTDGGWGPGCQCDGNDGSAHCVVLDPFAGSGTVLRVATRHGRDAVGIELNPRYLALIDDRTTGVQLSMESVV